MSSTMPSWSDPVRNEEFLTPTIWMAEDPKDSESNSQPATADGAFACKVHQQLLGGQRDHCGRTEV